MGDYVITADPDWIDDFNSRTVIPAGEAARSAQTKAGSIADLEFPPGLSDVGTALARVREGIYDAAGVCANRAELFSQRMTAVANNFRATEAENNRRINETMV